jgi:hypothetical protein
MVKRPTLDDIVYYTKRYGSKAGRATARGIHDAAEWTWDNAHPIWHKYSKPALAATIGYAGVAWGADQVIPVVNTALEYISPATQLLVDPIVNGIDLRGRVQEFYGYGPIRDQMVAITDAGLGYVASNFIPLTAKLTGAWAGIKAYNAFKMNRAPPLPRGNGLKDKSRRAFMKTTALAGIGLTGFLLTKALQPDATELYKRFGGTDFEDDITESFEKEDFESLNLEDLRQELLSLKSVNRPRMQKDAAYLKSLGYTNISDKDLYILSRVVAGEAGNYFKYPNHATRQSEDMRAITHVIFNRYLASKAHSGFRNDWAGDDNVQFTDVVLKWKQFSIANSRARKLLWEAGYQTGSLTFGTGKARSKTLLSYANVVTTLAHAAKAPNIDPTRGALNYKNNAVGYARAKKWDGSKNRGFKIQYTHNVQAHSYYSYYDNDGDNYALGLRAQAEKKKQF